VPDPLHPAVVHFPIALALLVPLFALLGVLAVRAGWLPRNAWAGVVLLQALLVGSAYLALETGEDQEDRVEEVVGHDPIHAHEEAAERLMWLAGATLVVFAAGLAGDPLGGRARVVSLLLSLAVAGASVPVGRSGGALVYEHGAASAYTDDAAARDAERSH